MIKTDKSIPKNGSKNVCMVSTAVWKPNSTQYMKEQRVLANQERIKQKEQQKNENTKIKKKVKTNKK